MQTESFGGHKYFVTFTDDYSCWCTVYFLKNNSEDFDKFSEYEAIITNQYGQNIGTLQTLIGARDSSYWPLSVTRQFACRDGEKDCTLQEPLPSNC